MVLTDKLTAIGDAVRAKTGTEDPMTLDEMATAIEGITTGSVDIPEDLLCLQGDQNYGLAGNRKTFVDTYGSLMDTKNLSSIYRLCYYSDLEELPFDLNGNPVVNSFSLSEAFTQSKLKKLPKIRNIKPNSLANLLSSAFYVKSIPADFWDEMDLSKINTATVSSSPYNQIIGNCYSLRDVSTIMPLFKQHNMAITNPAYSLYKGYIFYYTYALDEIRDIPVYTGPWTSNAFGSYFIQKCWRVKDITFEMPNGEPVVVKWKNQTIDLSGSSRELGYAGYATNYLTGYNSGITTDKRVGNDTHYQALKNDPDWYATSYNYSRYNHDSAVNTINSLPDTSAYLAEVGGTNTIKFYGVSGLNTDGGAINTLTEEEIAVATAKGWTVSLA